MSKNNEIYSLIIQRLVTAQYAFGDRILVKELAAETGASRQPIMAALNRLRADGFVRIIPQVGCQVIDPPRGEIADFFIMFERMEGVLAELAAARRTDDDLRQLKQTQAQLVRNVETAGSTDDYVGLNRSFHRILHAMARSPLLAEKQRSNFDLADFFITHSVGFKAFKTEAVAEHEVIIEALEKQRPDDARAAAEQHIGEIADQVLAGFAA